MKLQHSIAGLLLLLTSGILLSAHAEVQEVIQMPDKVFIPDGFDNNDHVEIVLHGAFRNSCYRAGPAVAKVVKDQIIIKNMAYLEQGTVCTDMMVPWTTTVSVGVLSTGKYQVLIQNAARSTQSEGSFFVAEAISKSIDDYLYAYVNSATVLLDPNGMASITISGSFSMSCMVFREVKIVHKKADVINVLPIIDIDKTTNCAHYFVPVPFQKTIHLKEALTERSSLFHVRSMNGQAINFVTE